MYTIDETGVVHHVVFERTPEEIAAVEAAIPDVAKARQLVEQAKAARQANRAYLDLTAPTLDQALAQIRALTVQMNAVIRLVAHDLTNGV